MRANRQPGTEAMAASTSAMTGHRAIAGSSRSFPRLARQATISGRSCQRSGNAASGEKPPVRARNTATVDTAAPGLTSSSP